MTGTIETKDGYEAYSGEGADYDTAVEAMQARLPEGAKLLNIRTDR